MKKLAIVTSTRADYGLLYPIIKEFKTKENENFRIEFIVTGTHLSNTYGMTIDEIKSDCTQIDHIVDCPIFSATVSDISNNISKTISKFTSLFVKENYNAIMLLGDRYEVLGIAIAATICKIPIFHIGGGDTTEGAIDECIRHSITKMSYLHFVTNDISRKRVVQLGENPARIHNVGSTGIDNMLSTELLDKQSALKSIGLTDCSYALCTYHPETLSEVDCKQQVKEFIDGIKDIPLEFIVTKSNSDLGGNMINEYLDKLTKDIPSIHVFSSLGRLRYLSLMKFSECVVGNSSSGIIETPYFRIPTVNIGDRQKGRLQSNTIYNTETNANSIKNTVLKILGIEKKKLTSSCVYPYGEGNSAQKIVSLSIATLEEDISLSKRFYDIGF